MSRADVKYLNYRLPVPDQFSEVFSHFYYADNNTSQPVRKTLLPSYQMMLIFSFGSNSFIHSENDLIEVDKCLFFGPVKRAFDYTLVSGSRILVINFKEDAFYRFFGPVNIAENLPLDPDILSMENCFTGLRDKLLSFNDPADQVKYVLAFCQPYLKQRHATTQQLIDIQGSPYNPIQKVADIENKSERNIQLHHKKHFGYSAKELSRYQRFLKAVEMMQLLATRATKDNWFEIIATCGYYDQSQFINDFQHFLNLSPTRYLKLQQRICNPVS